MAPTFADVPPDAEFYDSVEAAVQAGITRTYNPDEKAGQPCFNPTYKMKRVEGFFYLFVAFDVELVEIDEDNALRQLLISLYEAGVIESVDLEEARLAEALTRDDALQLIAGAKNQFSCSAGECRAK